MVGTVALLSAKSRCRPGVKGVGYRADPFYGQIWPGTHTGGQVVWMSYSQAVSAEQAGVWSVRGGMPDMTPDEALDFLENHKHRNIAVGIVASVVAWQAATEDHLAAILGRRWGLGDESKMLTALWVSGMLSHGSFVAGSKQRKGKVTLPDVWRVGDYRRIEKFLNRVSYAEWLSVTGGQHWRTNSAVGRHGIMATELSIRAGELCPSLGAVYGERFAKWKLLVPGDTSGRVADAVWVRSDGLKIAVEVTASTGQKLHKRAREWAEVLARDTDSELFVLFVDVSPHRSIWSDVQKALRNATSESLDATIAESNRRLAAARWDDWFPAVGQVSQDFSSLPCVNGRGEAVDLADPFSVPYGAGPSPALLNSPLIWSVPVWMRSTYDTPDLSDVIRSQAGLPLVEPLSKANTANLSDKFRFKPGWRTPKTSEPT